MVQGPVSIYLARHLNQTRASLVRQVRAQVRAFFSFSFSLAFLTVYCFVNLPFCFPLRLGSVGASLACPMFFLSFLFGRLSCCMYAVRGLPFAGY
jgi:hypothetical protein